MNTKMTMEEPHNTTLPQYIQNIIIQQVCISDREKSLYLGLVCWRWFHYLVMIILPKHKLYAMSASNVLESMYQHTRSKYCIYKGISEIITQSISSNQHCALVHSKEMETDYEWIRSFYGTLKTVSLQYNYYYSSKFIDQLFGDLIIKAENHFKLKELEQQQHVENKTLANKDRIEQGRIINLKDLYIHTITSDKMDLFQKNVSLVGPFCRHLTKLYLYLPLIYTADIILRLLDQTIDLKELLLHFTLTEKSDDLLLPKLINKFPLGLEFLQFFVDGREIPYLLLTKLPKLLRIKTHTQDNRKELIDFIMANQSITNLSDIELVYDDVSEPIFQHKENITNFTLLITGPEYIIDNNNQLQLKLHPLITELEVKFFYYDYRILDYIATQCTHLRFIVITIKEMIIQNLVDFIKHSQRISTVYYFLTDDDDDGDGNPTGILIEKEQLHELYQSVDNSKTMIELFLMIPNTITIVDYPETKDYDGWIIEVSNDGSCSSIDMYRKDKFTY